MTTHRIEKIIDHLVGSRLPLSTALSKVDLSNHEIIAEVLKKIRRNPLTDKWERYDTTQLQ